MRENVGNTDRWLRAVIGGALVLVAARSLGARRAIAPGLLLAGRALLLETALTRVCPLNAVLEIDTRRWHPFGLFGARFEAPGELSSSGQTNWRAQAEGGA